MALFRPVLLGQFSKYRVKPLFTEFDDRVPHLSRSNRLNPECTGQTRPAVRFDRTMPRRRHQMVHFGPQFSVERTKQLFDHLAVVTDAFFRLKNLLGDVVEVIFMSDVPDITATNSPSRVLLKFVEEVQQLSVRREPTKVD